MTNVVNLADFRKQPLVQPTDITRTVMLGMVEALRPYVNLTSDEVAADVKVLAWLTKGLVDRQYGKDTLAVDLLNRTLAEAAAIQDEVKNVVHN